MTGWSSITTEGNIKVWATSLLGQSTLIGNNKPPRVATTVVGEVPLRSFRYAPVTPFHLSNYGGTTTNQYLKEDQQITNKINFLLATITRPLQWQ